MEALVADDLAGQRFRCLVGLPFPSATVDMLTGWAAFSPSIPGSSLGTYPLVAEDGHS